MEVEAANTGVGEAQGAANEEMAELLERMVRITNSPNKSAAEFKMQQGLLATNKTRIHQAATPRVTYLNLSEFGLENDECLRAYPALQALLQCTGLRRLVISALRVHPDDYPEFLIDLLANTGVPEIECRLATHPEWHGGAHAQALRQSTLRALRQYTSEVNVWRRRQRLPPVLHHVRIVVPPATPPASSRTPPVAPFAPLGAFTPDPPRFPRLNLIEVPPRSSAPPPPATSTPSPFDPLGPAPTVALPPLHALTPDASRDANEHLRRALEDMHETLLWRPYDHVSDAIKRGRETERGRRMRNLIDSATLDVTEVDLSLFDVTDRGFKACPVLLNLKKCANVRHLWLGESVGSGGVDGTARSLTSICQAWGLLIDITCTVPSHRHVEARAFLAPIMRERTMANMPQLVVPPPKLYLEDFPSPELRGRSSR